MGRHHELDERGEHEGYVVGYVPRDWDPSVVATAIGPNRPVAVLEPYRPNVPLRELGLLAQDREHDVYGIYVIGYGCACGWRSPYRELGTAFEWSPSTVHWSAWIEDLLARKWWMPHVQAETRRHDTLKQGHTTDSLQVVLDLPRVIARDLHAFLESFGNSEYERVTRHLSREVADNANQGLTALGDELELLLREAAK